ILALRCWISNQPSLSNSERLHRPTMHPSPKRSRRRFRGIARGDFETFHDFLGENVRIRKTVGVFKAFVSAPEHVRRGKTSLIRKKQTSASLTELPEL